MNDERMKSMIRNAADDCLSGVRSMPSQRWAVMEKLEKKRGPAWKRAALAPATAALLVLVIAGAAAAGLGLFGQLRAFKTDEMDYNRLALLEENAVAIGETVAIRGMGELTIDQAYCDERKLYYAYTLIKQNEEDRLFVGDGAELAGGAYMNPVDSWMEDVDSRTTAAYYEVALPENFAPGRTIEFVLTVFAGDELVTVPVSAPVTGSVRMLTGEGTADGYPAAATLYISDVDISGSVKIAAPQNYEPEGYVLEAGGMEYRNIGGGFGYADGVHEVLLRFDLPADLADVKLVPLDETYAHETIELKESETE